MIALQDTLPPWPAAAVRDTVADIVRDPEYQRVLRDSLWDRFVRFIGHWLGEFLDLLPKLRISGWVLVAAAVVLVALIIARLVIGRRDADSEWGSFAADGRRIRRVDAGVEAARLAAAGEYTQAAHALCLALVASCAARGELVPHPSKTTGDYARELRRHGAPSERHFQRFRSRYDRIIYDAQRCTEADYTALLADAGPVLELARAA